MYVTALELELSRLKTKIKLISDCEGQYESGCDSQIEFFLYEHMYTLYVQFEINQYRSKQIMNSINNDFHAFAVCIYLFKK